VNLMIICFVWNFSGPSSNITHTWWNVSKWFDASKVQYLTRHLTQITQNKIRVDETISWGYKKDLDLHDKHHPISMTKIIGHVMWINWCITVAPQKLTSFEKFKFRLSKMRRKFWIFLEFNLKKWIEYSNPQYSFQTNYANDFTPKWIFRT